MRGPHSCCSEAHWACHTNHPSSGPQTTLTSRPQDKPTKPSVTASLGRQHALGHERAELCRHLLPHRSAHPLNAGRPRFCSRPTPQEAETLINSGFATPPGGATRAWLGEAPGGFPKAVLPEGPGGCARRTLCLLGSLRAARPACAAAATATRPPEPRELRRREVLGGLVSSRDAALLGASKPPATRLCPREVLKSRHYPRQPRGLELSPILKRPAVLIGFREGATVGGHTRCTGPAGQPPPGRPLQEGRGRGRGGPRNVKSRHGHTLRTRGERDNLYWARSFPGSSQSSTSPSHLQNRSHRTGAQTRHLLTPRGHCHLP